MNIMSGGHILAGGKLSQLIPSPFEAWRGEFF
jgi:hypothetical protein